jgi:hypothetical protein
MKLKTREQKEERREKRRRQEDKVWKEHTYTKGPRWIAVKTI